MPGNDDALRAIRLFTARVADAVLEGRGVRESATAEQNERGGDEGGDDRGRRQPPSRASARRRANSPRPAPHPSNAAGCG